MSLLGNHQETLHDLVSRVIDNGKAYARAEVALVKQTVSTRVEQLRPAAIFIVAAVLIVQAALTVLIGAIGMTLAIWIGPAGGLAVAAVLALVVAGLLAWAAMSRITRIRP